MKNILMILFFTQLGLYAQHQEKNITRILTTEKAEVQQYYTPKEISVSKIFRLAYPLAEYESMIIRSNELASILVAHKNDLQSGTMTKTQIKELKRDLVEAKLLHYRMDDFTTMYHKVAYPIQDYLSIETLNNYKDFSEVLTSTTQYAGF